MKAECPHKDNAEMVTKSLQGWKIYKDQCVRCFHEPNKPEGLFVCMKCFNGFCPADRDQHSADHKHFLYYHYTKVLKKSEEKVEITKIGIGIEGGASNGPDYEHQYSIYCSQCKAQDFQGAQLFQAQKNSFINTQSAFKQQLAVEWELQQQPCEHTLTLEQAPANSDFSKCTKCDLSANLWLCLTCGVTGCARKQWDGSGGNNHGVDHYTQSKHPLVVKLGTINAQGNASLYCYECDKQIKDNFLADHLQILGINMNSQKKTEKTIAEMTIEMNLNFSLNRLIEGNKEKSIPMYGPGYTGMDNIGNSCYLNSVVQTLNSLSEYKQQYFVEGSAHLKTCKRIPMNCFYCQISKISWGLHSGKYSQKLKKTQIINDQQQIEQYQEAIKPYHFKTIIAADNKDFASSQQQDALEYLQWLLDRLEKEEPKYNGIGFHKLFNFYTTNVMVCTQCNGQKHVTEKTNQFKFPISHPTQNDIDGFYATLEKQTNKDIKQSKLNEDPQYHVNFDDCVSLLKIGDSREIECSKCGQNRQFICRSYLKTTPKYLMAIPNRFYIEGNAQRKLNALIKMPQILNISEFLLKNVEIKGEVLKEEKKKKYNQESVQMLMQMGQTRNASIRALLANQGNVEAACNWVFQNMDRPDLNDPIPEQDSDNEVKINQQAVQQVMGMGFDDKQAKIALIKNNSDIPQAIEWLFGCGGDVSPFMDLLKPKAKAENIQAGPINDKYKLKSVIIHLGKTVHHGHYVTYIQKQGKWVLYNDDKVSIPQQPVLGKGYIYLYEAL